MPLEEVEQELAILRWVDPDLCRDLLGPDGLAGVAGLRARGILADASERPGALRFAEGTRRELEAALRWRDPARHHALHRRAAELWLERTEVAEAHWHLLAAGDAEAAFELVIRPALDLVDRGDQYGLARLVAGLPTTVEIQDPRLAADMAVVAFFARRPREAAAWCERAEQLAAADDVGTARRAAAMRSLLALVDGDLDGARACCDVLDALGPDPLIDDPIVRWHGTIRARVALFDGDLARARQAIEEVGALDEPASIMKVTFPALQAWYELALGRVRSALDLAEQAAQWATSERVQLHLGAVDAYIVTGWCHLGVGDLLAAQESAVTARTHAEALGYPLVVARAAALSAEVLRLRGSPRAALEVLRDARMTLARPGSGLVGSMLDEAEVAAALAGERLDDVAPLLGRLPAGPGGRLLAAQAALAGRRPEDVAGLLDGADGWPTPARLRAEVLLAAAGDGGVDGALGVGAETGWVSPFLGLPPPAAALLSAAPVERLHPGLAAVLAPAGTGPGLAPTEPAEPLTPRELEVLAFLPTHLSYAQIAERVYLSVNTVKTTLKSVYRKLHARSRAEAVDAARRAGLL